MVTVNRVSQVLADAVSATIALTVKGEDAIEHVVNLHVLVKELREHASILELRLRAEINMLSQAEYSEYLTKVVSR